YWPAFLLSAGLELPKKLLVHGYVTVEGEKMSKTIGNVVDPFSLIEKYGTDPIRYYLLREIPTSGDGDFSEKRFMELYNADLANGLGNLVARLTKLAEGLDLGTKAPEHMSTEVSDFIESFDFARALQSVWTQIAKIDAEINKAEPWKMTDNEQKNEFLKTAINHLLQIGVDLIPFLPKTSHIILITLQGTVSKPEALFPRL
ncbi:MAG: class I tRNA ligase family protein, partial [Microgenomates group bacterium]